MKSLYWMLATLSLVTAVLFVSATDNTPISMQITLVIVSVLSGYCAHIVGEDK
jgi:hypothetical protein